MIRMVTILLLVFVTNPKVYAYGVWEEDLVGTLSRRTQKNSHTWASLAAGVVDGQIKTTPPDEVIFDRRFESRLSLGAEAFFSGRMGVRLNLAGESERRRIADQKGLGAIIDETKTLYKPALDGTFVTDKGLEIILGVVGHFYGKDRRTTATDFGSTTVTNNPARALGRRLAILRRAPQWNGGFAYTKGGNSSRSLKEEVFDGSSAELVDTIYIPSRIDMFGEGGSPALKMRFHLGFIQARGLGPVDNRGNTIYTDHLEAILGLMAPMGGMALDGAIGHRTLSYSSSAFVGIDTTPVTTFHLKMFMGPVDDSGYLGVYMHRASDGQSLPEFNSEYNTIGGGVNFGYCARL